MIREGTAWKASLPAVLGKTPYGMIGRVEETSASFEARSAPRSHPTPISCRERMQQMKLRLFAYSINPSAVAMSGGNCQTPWSFSACSPTGLFP
jgi:hypothetical protein